MSSLITNSRKLIRGASTSHQPLAPVDRLPLVDGFAGLEDQVQQFVEVLGGGRLSTFRQHVSGRGPFALFHQHMGR